ncbi:GntR family transcriptional regulator [Streptomyces caniscabiei]|uniref:GntR family transcriptional regulator n=1 Tax=Streptomyces caniscabiei TaxID=2746961 RepID=UPI0038F5FD80
MTREPGQPPIDPTKIAYVYMQLADHIAERIAKGDLRPGARLPGERDLAAEYGVAHLTVRRATRELRERGLVVTLPAKGTFVAYPEDGDAEADS